MPIPAVATRRSDATRWPNEIMMPSLERVSLVEKALANGSLKCLISEISAFAACRQQLKATCQFIGDGVLACHCGTYADEIGE